MPGTPSVQTALKGLPTSRIQRLVDELEADPDVEVTVCGWWPQCPMTLAGYQYLQSTIECNSGPERQFAVAWDHFAQRESKRWWHTIVDTPHRARRGDVQALLRAANEVLASRSATRNSGVSSRPLVAPEPAAGESHQRSDAVRRGLT